MMRGVPELEIAAILGHRGPNIRTTGRYIHVAPRYLAGARRALDELANEIGRVATRSMLPLRVSCVQVQPLWEFKSLNSGAGDGI